MNANVSISQIWARKSLRKFFLSEISRMKLEWIMERNNQDDILAILDEWWDDLAKMNEYLVLSTLEEIKDDIRINFYGYEIEI